MPKPRERLRLCSYGAESTTVGGNGHGRCDSVQNIKQRIVFMGAAKVGKTSIISQFLYDRFPTRYKGTIEELHRSEYDMQDGTTLTLDILDTSGAHEFPAMRDLSISTADGFILVFSIDNLASWDEVRTLRNQIVARRGAKVPIVVVGNKKDLEDDGVRVVTKEAVNTTVIYDWDCGLVECSARSNHNIIEIFKELLNQAKVRYNLSPAVRKRRQSLPNYVSSPSNKGKFVLKRNSCIVA